MQRGDRFEKEKMGMTHKQECSKSFVTRMIRVNVVPFKCSCVQEVIFKVTDASLPNLTMVNLPSLPAPTDEMYEEVKRLVNREVQNPHNIVLCIDW
jgi:hypothetical protein